MKKPNQRSLTQKAVKAMTVAVSKVVADRRRRRRRLAVWRNGKACWVPATQPRPSDETHAISQAK